MEIGELLKVIATSTSGVAIGGLIMWARFRNKDRATTKKAEAEAFQIEIESMSDGYRDLIAALNKIRHVEAKAFEKIVDELRLQINILEKNQLNYQRQLDENQQKILDLHRREDQCQQKVSALTVENKNIREQLTLLQKLNPGLQ